MQETSKWIYLVFECPECGKRKYVYFTCKSRICTSCGTKSANEWADKIHHRLLNVPHRHVVFTIPDTLWELFNNPAHQKILFMASKVFIVIYDAELGKPLALPYLGRNLVRDDNDAVGRGF